MELLITVAPNTFAAYASGLTTSTKGYAEMPKLKSVAHRPISEVHFSHFGRLRRTLLIPMIGIENMAM
jgi:hypothetical protein